MPEFFSAEVNFNSDYVDIAMVYGKSSDKQKEIKKPSGKASGIWAKIN